MVRSTRRDGFLNHPFFFILNFFQKNKYHSVNYVPTLKNKTKTRTRTKKIRIKIKKVDAT